MLNIILIIVFILITIYCIARTWEHRHEDYDYLFTLSIWLLSVSFLTNIYYIMKDGKNTLHSYPGDQCIYETKIAKLQDGTIMPVEIWVGCKNEQCEFKNSR